jgi:hypothetical protein
MLHVVVSLLGCLPLGYRSRNASAFGFKCKSPKALALTRANLSLTIMRSAFLFCGSASGSSCFSPASGLHVAVTNKAALPAAAACFGAAHGLQVAVADQAALATTPAGGGAAIGLLVGVLNEPTLARAAA